ncbi:uncharacterized protein LOC127806898 [Diospyros lotus]|uniref:uncharacterized protein LOC127806898 n=1 Tax=Diospyros lotus TaxID=55363 RepID=UPI0022552F63|nr:uncharacterized protein LOC127806898 [Diospyros lotus]
MAKRFRGLWAHDTENLRLILGAEIEKLQCHPVLIAMMGHPCTGRKVAAYLLAATLKCPLVKEEDIQAKSNYQDEEENEDEVQALITRGWDKPPSLEDLQRQLLETANTYDAGETPKFIMKMSVDGEKYECVSKVLVSIVSRLYPDHHQVKGRCGNGHAIDYTDEQENYETSCNDCSKPVSGFNSYKCSRQGCNFILHKSCAKQLPSELRVIEHGIWTIHLRNAEDYKSSGGVRCSCCEELITGYFYRINNLSVLDLKCLLLPSKRRVKLHKHRLQLTFDSSGFACGACGIYYDYPLALHYFCRRCPFKVDVNCAWLPDTAIYKTHKYPFKLTLCPQDDTKQELYCMFCQEIIDPNYWMYNCEGDCDHPAHARCLVPSARPPEND